MAVESPPWALQAGSYPAEQTRRAVFAWLARTGSNTPGIVAGGLLSSTDCQLSAPVSGMSVNLSTGELIIGGSEGGAQGAGYGRVTSQTNLSIAAANASLPRIDTVCATMSDAAYTEPTGGSGSQWAPQVVTGTATAGATLTNLNGAATLPLSSLLLGYVLVPATATNIITADITNVATIVAPQGAAGRLVARQFYAPAETTYTVATGGVGTANGQSLDTTNLTIAFTAPASGAVIVRLQAYATATATNDQAWYLVTHGTHTVIGVPQIAVGGTGGAAMNAAVTLDYLVTGLVPGAAVQYDWAATSSAASSCSVSVGPGTGTHNYGAGVIEVLAA